MCSHIRLKERTRIQKAMFQQWRQKRKHSVHDLLPQQPKERSILRTECVVTCQQQGTRSSTKDVNLGTITSTLSWYKFSPLRGIRVKPKLLRRRRRIYESSFCRRRSQNLLWQMVRKIIRKRLRMPRTRSETGDQESHVTAIGKSFDLKNKKKAQKIWNMLGLFKDTSFIVIIMNREVQIACREKNHSLFHKTYTFERNSSEKKYTMRWEDWKSHNS